MKTMRINYRTDAVARKLFFVYQLFSPGAMRNAKGYAQFLGTGFYAAAKAQNYIFSGRGTRSDTEAMCREILSAAPGTATQPERRAEAMRLLDAIDVPLLDDDDPVFTCAESGINTVFKECGDRIDSWLGRIFGFRLPDEITLILGEYHDPNSSGGGSMVGDPVIIGYLVNGTFSSNPAGAARRAADVMQHELLHSLIARSRMIKAPGVSGFEEALLDYFAPSGMLSAKVGLADRYDLMEQHSLVVANRPGASRESERLMPAMEEYNKVCGDVTVWGFLAAHGFEGYIGSQPQK